MKLHKHKFFAKPTEYDGVKYHSKKEAKYAHRLNLLKKSGEIIFYLRQVPVDLPGGVKYRVDFVEFREDGTVHFIDVKGFDTPTGKMKRKMTEDLYPIKIELA